MKPMNVLGREYSMEILRATGTPRSVTDLSDAIGVPIATCYRRVEELVAVGFLEEHGETGSGREKSTLYCRTADAVGVDFESMSVAAWTCLSRAQSDEPSPNAAETTGRRENTPTVPAAAHGPLTEAAGDGQKNIKDDIRPQD